MEYQLYNFLPLYNPVEKYDEFTADINNLKEFTRYRLSKQEDFPADKTGQLMQHQKFISTFVSPNTPYDGILMFHEMGVGKTCTAVAVAEKFIKAKKEQDDSQYPTTTVKKIVILTKGKGLQTNFVNEIAYVCTDGQYLEGVDDRKYVKNKYKKITKNVKVKYTFNTFEIFAKSLRESNESKKMQDYEDSLFIVDEAHNLRSAEVIEQGIYKEIYDLFDLLKRKKILLLTGTPMKDKPDEIVGLLNLIVKDKLRMSDLKEPDLFKRKVTGYVSYLKAMTSEVTRVDEGRSVGELTHLKVYPVVMSDFQSKVYSEAIRQDSSEKSIFSGSRQASAAVFPDGTYGKKGFDNNVVQSSTGYRFGNRETATEMQKNLGRYSAKYADLLKKLADDYANNRLSFVFSEFVKGSGLIVLSMLLELNGYTRVDDADSATTEAKRYAVFTNDTSTTNQTRKIIGLFNNPKNSRGRYVSTILGSRVIMEGFSFKNIQSEYVLTPHWNYSETSQIIARGFRAGSHNDLLKDGVVPTVRVYHYASMPTDKVEYSIDLHMYEIAEKKDFAIQKVVKLLKETAVDCALNKERNTVTDVGLNNTRTCEYGSCEYKCDNTTTTRDLPNVDRNYDLMYARTSKEYEDLKIFITTELKTKGFACLEKIARETTARPVEIAALVNDMLNANDALFDRPEGCYYLNVGANDVLYAHLKPNNGADQNLASDLRYTPIFIGKGIDELVHDVRQDFMVELTRKMFKSKNLKQLQTYLQVVPLQMQEKLLCCSINNASIRRSSIADSNNGNFIADMVLNNYNLYFAFPDASSTAGSDAKAFVWLDAEQPKCTSDLSDVDAWRKCTILEQDIVKSLTGNRAEASKSNQYGYVGLVNRLTNDFCLRRVDDADTGTAEDKRKRNVGKRCQNWKKVDLVDLIANRLRVEPDDDNFTVDVDSMKKDPKFAGLLDSNNTDDKDYKRLAFWNAQRVEHICNKIMDRMGDENLLVNDPNCGTTKKVR